MEILGLIIAITASFLIFMWVLLPTLWGAPYIPSAFNDVKRMLQLIDLQPNQILVDLGAGDGRIIILGALLYKAKCEGIEIDLIRYKFVEILISVLGLKNQSCIKWGDLYDYDLSKADIVTMYLLPDAIEKLKDHLLTQLHSGTKVVSFKFPIPGWNPTYIDDQSTIFVYEINKNA